ncbi:hypothetical protein MKZ38_005707 [Zalerion maritima]|uniref:Vacuolar membrane-associated protein IML1 n=1 Tax=Zalerion maritima TaxID=339359 RepID=A0AAD5RJW1_9PEZI|nr:hypothetical protein MKZ38_005707 [Zalerion maritima]
MTSRLSTGLGLPRPRLPSHLRQFSRGTAMDRSSSASSIEPVPSPAETISSNSTARECPSAQKKPPPERICTVSINEGFSKDEVQMNLDLFDNAVEPGSMMAMHILKTDQDKKSKGHDIDPKRRHLIFVKDMAKELKARHPNTELYVTRHFADSFGVKTGCQVLLTPVDPHAPDIEASHVELSFRDQYLSRADMWRLTIGELADKIVYKGQMILFMGTVKCHITAVYVEGEKVQSAFFGRNSRPIFRSESARYVIFIQMAQEMWEFDSDGSGEIMFNKCVNGFLPTLFKKWAALKVKHLVSIVLFSRVEFDTGLSAELGSSTLHQDYYTGVQPTGPRRPYKDFYRVVVSEMASGEWTTILHTLKKESNSFRKDISLHHLRSMGAFTTIPEDASPQGSSGSRIKAEPSLATYGNFLEAISLASSQFAHDHIDRDLTRTGISVVVITPGSGVFEVDYESLRRTTEALVGNGIGIDLICMPKMPLHSVPLFRYHNPLSIVRPRSIRSYDSTPRGQTPLAGSYNSLAESLSPTKASDSTIHNRVDANLTSHREEWCYAIPQWLHVSYWSGNDDEALSYQGIALSPPAQQEQAEFKSRCRMYNLQMRSVLEANEIEVTPLQEDPQYPRLNPESPSSRKHRGAVNSRTTHNFRAPDSLYEYVEGFRKFVPDRLVKTGEASIWKQLQEFDESRAKLPSRRRYRPEERREMASLSSSIKEKRYSGGQLASLSTSAKEKKSQPAKPITTTKMTSPPKTPKLMRQISLGQRGFGIAKPKAAVGETKAENAVATLSKLQPTPSKPGPVRPSSPQTISSNTSISDQSQSVPIVIKNTPTTGPITAASLVGSSFSHRQDENPELEFSDVLRQEDVQRLYNSKLLAEALPELPQFISTAASLSPWLSVVNPSNPDVNRIDAARLFSRWQHVFPRPSDMRVMKWKALCCPAAVPLTTEYFPTRVQFEAEYISQPYNIDQSMDDELAEEPKSRDDFLRELVGLRFSQGFQIVVGSAIAKAFGQRALKITDIFSRDHTAEDGTSVFMSVGNMIHQLSCVNNTEVEINIFSRKKTEPSEFDGPYTPAVRTILDADYETTEIDVIAPEVDRKWNYIDQFVASHDEEMLEQLRFWRARFVLIPVAPRNPSVPRTAGGDSEEEIRLEGIKRLGQLWQKHRWLAPSERRFSARKIKDPNPLDIVYKTEDASAVIAIELENLIEGLEGSGKGRLLNKERFRRDDLNAVVLAEAIQQPVEKGGIRMRNRRWHLRLHYNCFIGSDMTTWLLENFEDLESREEAEAFGNRLMAGEDNASGIFVHVEKRHPFRDGQYFYQIVREHAKPHAQGWFNSIRRNDSVPSTPISERPPTTRPSGDPSPISGTTTPTAVFPGGIKPKVVLSKVMKYDVDHRKKSYRPERINLHYDRLHNPDNCYHIRIDWMNVTAKLIEDAVGAWARLAGQYGLQLVEVPIAEACTITDNNPFRRPFILKLAIPPPDHHPEMYYDATSLTPHALPVKSRHFYQRAILRRFDFVLDMEASSNFPSAEVDISYSWGRPDFVYSQYIHRSGTLLAEITDDGDILLLANRLAGNRVAVSREKEMRIGGEQSNQQGTLDRSTARMVSSGAYTNYGIAEPTPVTSPLLRATAAPPSQSEFLNHHSPMARTTSTDALPAMGSSTFGNINPSGVAMHPHGTAPPHVGWTGSNKEIAQTVKEDLEIFCMDGPQLDAFYKELVEKAATAISSQAGTPSARPTSPSASGIGPIPEVSIPSIGLGPGLMAASELNGGNSPRMNSPAQALSPFARRASVQDGILGSRVSHPDRSSGT